MEEFQQALEGKISTEDWDAAKLVDYHKFLKDESKTEEGKVAALREAKRVENDRVEKAKKEADEAEEAAKKAKEGVPPKPDGDEAHQPSPEMTQFRTEQVDKAKKKFYSTVKLSDEEKAAVEEKFERLDSGKLDADLIYEDVLSAFAAANPTRFLELKNEKDAAEAAAQKELESQASPQNGKPGDPEPKKFSDEALALSRRAGISPEAATRQISGEGMSRVIEPE